MVHELCQREEEAGRVTPPEYATSGGYGSPLRGAHRKGPPRGGRHQPLLSELPTVFVHITECYVTLPQPLPRGGALVVALRLRNKDSLSTEIYVFESE